MAVKRSRKTRKTARKTRKIARKTRKITRKTRRKTRKTTRRKTRKTARGKAVKKAKKRPVRRKRSTQSPSVKYSTDIGTLSLRPYINAKRKAKQDEIKKYEQKYLARYKQPKVTQAKSSNVKHDTDLSLIHI